MSTFTLNAAQNRNTVRHTLTNSHQGLLDVIPLISPFERWSDDVYTPVALQTRQTRYSDLYRIEVDLPGDEDRVLNIELCKDRLIVLVTSADPFQQGYEYYTEIDVPPQTHLQRAIVEFNNHALTVSFDKMRPGLIEQAIAAFPWNRAQKVG